MARGRPPAIRGVFAFDDSSRLALAPHEIVLDTSFVVEALVSTQTGHPAARNFLEQIVAADTTVYFNRLLELELAETAFQLALKERHPKNWRRVRHDGRSRRRGTRLLDAATQAWDGVLRTVDWARIEVEEVVDQVPDLMSNFGLSSYDAVHVSTAFLLGVRDVATLDAGFASVPEDLLNIHIDRTRVRRCTEIRARR